MKNFLKAILVVGLVGMVGVSTLNASDAKGKKIYKSKIKKSCGGKEGSEMTGLHSQKEWKKIFDDGKLKDEIKRICPDVKDKKLKDKYLKHLYDFFFKYANDSGVVPSC